MIASVTLLSASKWLRLGLACGVLLAVTLACYTPWRKSGAEREAVVQFAHIEETIYEPPDAVLLAEVDFSGLGLRHAFAGVERIYMTVYSCEEIVAEYREAMVDTGWVVGSGDCGQEVWLAMHTSKAQFLIEATPSQESRLAEEWQHLQEQHRGLYYVISNLSVQYEEP